VTPLAPNGLAARIVLAILVAVGILYGNLGPLIVSGLAHRDFTSANAGYLLSINLYGTALGAMLIVFGIRRLPWRSTAALLMLVVLLADLWSAWRPNPETLHLMRFLHGVAGGASIGVISSVIARTTNPERTFALTVLIQLTLGGLGTSVLAPMVVESGVAIVWMSLAAFTTLALAVLPWLDRYPAPESSGHDGAVARRRAPWPVIALACAALFLYQSGEMAIFAYVIELGARHSLDERFIGNAVAIGLWLGGPTALVVAWWSTRSGRLLPSAAGTALTAASLVLFLAPSAVAYLGANVGFGIFFALALPYLLGIVSEMDNSGQMAALGGFVNSFGLATGPAIAASILGDDQYDRVVLFGVTALAMAALMVAAPARLLDRKDKRARVVW